MDGAQIRGNLTPSLGVGFDYAHRPFVGDNSDCVIDATTCTAPQETDFVAALATARIYGSLALFEHFQIGLNIPIHVYGSGAGYSWLEPAPPPSMGNTGRSIDGGETAALGDVRLHLKATFLDAELSEDMSLHLGVAAWVTAPFGHLTAPGHFMGDTLPSAGGHLIAHLRAGPMGLALNLGGQFRDEQTSLISGAGSEMTFGLGASVDIEDLMTVLVELQGATTFGSRFDSEVPLELRFGSTFHIDDFHITAGGGLGLVYGIGVPEGRAFLSGSWGERPPRDADGDGIVDEEDACPSVPEDDDDWEATDGCPEDDNDGDGLADAADQCPNEAEDPDGRNDEDGCPDLDDDGDGIPDGYDSCPTEAEDMDNDRDDDGCPDNDRDRDGVTDDRDQCPDSQEDFDGWGDEDGCPEDDFDQDGIVDDNDQCPDQPEDLDGDSDEDGCPDEAPAEQAPEAPPQRHRDRDR